MRAKPLVRKTGEPTERPPRDEEAIADWHRKNDAEVKKLRLRLSGSECQTLDPLPPVRAVPATPVILEIQSLFGTGGYKNPTPGFDLNTFSWGREVCGSNTWLSGYNPAYEWMPILDKNNELENADVAISGTAINSHRSSEDVWFTHPFGKDLNFDVAPDPEYSALPSPIQKPDPDPNGRDNSIVKARTVFGLDVRNVLHVEMEEGFVPSGYETKDGDRVAVLGRWIVDCGHDDWGAEIHPPLLYLAARPDGPDTTHVSLISRSFLVSQRFGDGALYEHLINQLATVYPIFVPFPLTQKIEARPQIFQVPFSGAKLFNVAIRPPTPRLAPNDQLVVSYALGARTGVALELYKIDNDTIGLAISMNDVAYPPAPLPNKQNRNVSVKEIREARPDIADLIFHLQGSASALANPWGAIVLDRGVDTDFYPMPTFVEPPRQSTSVAQLPVKFKPDDGIPWPIWGHIDLRWERNVVIEHPVVQLPVVENVPANVLWVDTGLTLQQGQQFRIEASGQWSNTGPPSLGPDGFKGYLFPGTVLPSASLASLIGKVGDVVFALGGSFEGPSPSSGRLFLSINDTPDTFSDNQGSLSVAIWLH